MSEMQTPTVSGNRGIFALRRFVWPGKERCELCRAAIAERHAHLLGVVDGQLRCACATCAIADRPGYLRVSTHRDRLANLCITAAQWRNLGIPVELAFLVRHADGHASAHYPGPAGVVRSAISPEAWTDLVMTNPPVAGMEAEVEALLVNRAGGPGEAWRVSIDQCYALAGIMRRHWRGFSGGPEVWAKIESWLAAPLHTGNAGGHA